MLQVRKREGEDNYFLRWGKRRGRGVSGCWEGHSIFMEEALTIDHSGGRGAGGQGAGGQGYLDVKGREWAG